MITVHATSRHTGQTFTREFETAGAAVRYRAMMEAYCEARIEWPDGDVT